MIKNLFFVAFIVGFTACSSGSKMVSESKPGSSAGNPELEELFWARQDSAKMNFTQADVNFMIGMIGHHAQALIMSDLAPKNGASVSVQTLASRIINAQQDEISTMQTWLKDRGQPVPEIHIEGLMLMIHGVGHHNHMDHSNMPGMLSQEQLNELGEAKGNRFDRLFLEYMIEHHEGAVIMVDQLFAIDGAALDDAVFKLASDIQAEQRTEIARMKFMLNTM